MGEGRYSFSILTPGIRWGWVVSFRYLSLHPQRNSTQYQRYRRLAHESVWTLRRKISCPYRELNTHPSIVQPVSSTSRYEVLKMTVSFQYDISRRLSKCTHRSNLPLTFYFRYCRTTSLVSITFSWSIFSTDGVKVEALRLRARFLRTQTQTQAVIHPCSVWHSNARSHCWRSSRTDQPWAYPN
jgi:hypothetical protein